jgi:type IX secretion system PorP/SprF family membrane protein
MLILKFIFSGIKSYTLSVILISVWATENLLSQQIPSFSQYTFDSYLLNPALAGGEGYTIFSLIAKEQWVGITDAPKAHAINFQARIFNKTYRPTYARPRKVQLKLLRGGKVGLGLTILDNRAGIFDRTSLKFAYAYHITKSRAQFSFGLGMSLSQLKIDFDKVRLEDAEINLTSESSPIRYIPDFNLGFNYTKDNLFAGFSIENIMKIVSFGTGHFSDGSQRFYNLIGGIHSDLTKEIEIEPSLYLKSSDLIAFQAEINTKLTFEKNYWIGYTYRTLKSTSIQLGIKIKRVFIGYAYDYGFNALQKNTCGTHELMMSLKLGDNNKRYRWLERY